MYFVIILKNYVINGHNYKYLPTIYLNIIGNIILRKKYMHIITTNLQF